MAVWVKQTLGHEALHGSDVVVARVIEVSNWLRHHFGDNFADRFGHRLPWSEFEDTSSLPGVHTVASDICPMLGVYSYVNTELPNACRNHLSKVFELVVAVRDVEYACHGQRRIQCARISIAGVFDVDERTPERRIVDK